MHSSSLHVLITTHVISDSKTFSTRGMINLASYIDLHVIIIIVSQAKRPASSETLETIIIFISMYSTVQRSASPNAGRCTQ